MKDIVASALFSLGSLTVVETSYHGMGTLRQPEREVHMAGH